MSSILNFLGPKFAVFFAQDTFLTHDAPLCLIPPHLAKFIYQNIQFSHFWHFELTWLFENVFYYKYQLHHVVCHLHCLSLAIMTWRCRKRYNLWR